MTTRARHYPRRLSRFVHRLRIAGAVSGMAVVLGAIVTPPGFAHAASQQERGLAQVEASQEPGIRSQRDGVIQTVRRIPLAAVLGALLAFRPRRRGTPPRTTAVVQTQIILAIVGAVVMLVVGSSVARAFGIVGAASLVRYRAKIDDPKDAGIMLSTLGIGLASGAGLYFLAIFATLFIALVVGVLESFEPERYKLFSLKVKTKDVDKLRPRVQLLLRRNRIRYEVRSAADDEIVYEVKVPALKKTDGITDAIHDLNVANEVAVEWEEKKELKPK